MSQARANPREPGERRSIRCGAAVLGTIALLLQALVFTLHQSAQAAVWSPFQDAAAWCITTIDKAPGAPAKPSPPRKGMLCPLCQNAQGTGALLPPFDVVVIRPTWARVVQSALPHSDGLPVANPFIAHARAPPSAF